MPAIRRQRRDDRPRTLRKDRTGRSPLLVGSFVLVAILIICYFGFTKDWPLSRGFEFKAVVPSANSIRLNSPVRIAGVNVGKVVKVEGQEGTDNAVLTMEMKNEGLPIHKDARLKIRPRIFLEGNFFVDLQPGTPATPTISDGDTLPVDQSATPVQFDQILTALQQDTRRNLQIALDELGAALTDEPTPAEDADQPLVTRGKNAAQALNSAIRFGAPALRDTAIVQNALQGTRPDDLTGLVRGLADIGAELRGRERSLTGLVENFNTTMGALASEQGNLRATVGELGPTVHQAFVTFGALNDSLPNVRAFSQAIIPGVEETQPTIDALTPWIAQARPLVSQAELGGLVADTQPATASLAALTSDSVGLLKAGDLLARCFSDVILPTGDVKLDDGALSTGKENYKEFWYAMVGLAGEGANFDGNGNYVRFQTGGGQFPVSMTGGNLGGTGKMFGNSVGRPGGTKPAWTQTKPPYKKNSPCYKQPIPDFAATPTGPSDGG